MGERISRRELLRRAAWLLPAMHALPSVLTAGTEGAEAGTEPMRLEELSLQCADPPSLTVFYREVLGLPVIESGDELSVMAGGTRIRFSPAPQGTAPFYHVAFNIPENQLARAMEWLTERPARSAGESPVRFLRHRRTGREVVHFESINAHSVYFFDPAGNLLEFIARHNLRNGVAGAFSERGILCASEIGLVARDVLETVAFLGDSVGQRSLLGRAPSAHFTAVGSEHGVFIVVPRQRVWLMTELPAASFPASATINGTGAVVRPPETDFEVRRSGVA